MNLLDLGYLAAGAAASPLLAFRWATDRRYRHRLSERFGAVPEGRGGPPRLWFHAASVGEVALIRPLIGELRRRRPSMGLAVSTNTAAGREQAEKLFPEAPVFYFPLDLSGVVRRALKKIRPDLVVLVELEVWPNFTREARRAGIPVIVVNGRISDRSFGRYRRFRPFLRPMFSRLEAAGAQSEVCAERMREMGASGVRVTGNLKFDVSCPFDPEEERKIWLGRLGFSAEAPVLLAGSTHDPEERILVEVYRRILPSSPGLRLVIAPRHLERVAEVEKIVEGAGFRCYKRSRLAEGEAVDGIVLLDTVGELSRAYAMATVVFIGGTFGPRGGQNMLEPAVLGKPILSGPSLHNFRDAALALVEGGGLSVLDNPIEIGMALQALLRDPSGAKEMGERSRRVVESGRGAVERTADLVEAALEPRKSGAAVS